MTICNSGFDLYSIMKILLLIILRPNISYFGPLLAQHLAQRVPNLQLVPLSTTTTQQWIPVMLVVLQLKLPGMKWHPSRYQETLPLIPTPPLCPPWPTLPWCINAFLLYSTTGRKELLQGRTTEAHDRISDLYKVMQETWRCAKNRV